MLMIFSLGVAVLILAAVTFFGQIYQVPSFEKAPVVLSDGWRMTVEGDATASAVEMPVTLPGAGKTFQLERELGAELMEGFDQPPSIFLRAKYMDVDVLLNGVLLDSYRIPENGWSYTGGTVLRIVSLPDGWENQTLSIRGKLALGGDTECTLGAPWFTPQGTLFYSVFRNDLAGLVGNAAIFAIGLVMLVGGVLCGKVLGIRRRLVCTGIFAILFVCYDTCLTDTAHLLVGNTYLLYMLEFFSLMTVSLPLLLLGRETATGRAVHVIDVILAVASLNFLIQVSLHFLKVFELRRMLIFDHGVILLSVAAVFAALVGRSKSRAQWQFVYSMVPLVIGGLVDMVRFYFNWSEPLNMAFRLGTMVFVLVQVFFAVRSYLEVYRGSVESAHYQKLAYLDSLTGIQNRAAFERDMQVLEAALETALPVWILMGDVNGLKALNDRDGHLEGDRLLKKAAEVLTGSLGGKGNAYRIGGDEFAVLLSNQEEPSVQELVERIRQKSNQANRERPMLGLSVGYASYLPQDKGSLERVLSRADARMYEEKQRTKQLEAREQKDNVVPSERTSYSDQ